MKRLTIKEFWKRINRNREEKCWEFNGHRSWQGYGKIKFQGRNLLAHRLAWELTYGRIPKGKLVCNHCDNSSCCNPKQLFLGTNADNMRDMKNKGRRKNINTGENNGRSKLTSKQIVKIRKMYNSGKYLQREIGDKFNVTQVMIGYIVRKDNWKN